MVDGKPPNQKIARELRFAQVRWPPRRTGRKQGQTAVAGSEWLSHSCGSFSTCQMTTGLLTRASPGKVRLLMDTAARLLHNGPLLGVA